MQGRHAGFSAAMRHERRAAVPMTDRRLPSRDRVIERPAAPVRTGVLIVNLGTPDAADAPSVRRYLKEFLADPRVIENQGLLWKLVLNGIILPLRPRRKARDYARSGTSERNELPLQDDHPLAGLKARAPARRVGRRHHGRLGDALRQSLDRLAHRGAGRRPAASASCCCRSIRNMPRPRPRPSATRRSRR